MSAARSLCYTGKVASDNDWCGKECTDIVPLFVLSQRCISFSITDTFLMADILPWHYCKYTGVQQIVLIWATDLRQWLKIWPNTTYYCFPSKQHFCDIIKTQIKMSHPWNTPKSKFSYIFVKSKNLYTHIMANKSDPILPTAWVFRMGCKIFYVIKYCQYFSEIRAYFKS